MHQRSRRVGSIFAVICFFYVYLMVNTVYEDLYGAVGEAMKFMWCGRTVSIFL